MFEKVIIFDTSLRDGEQAPGATMNLPEKKHMAGQLESLGVNVIEAGFPASSPGDFEAVQAIAGLVRNCEVAGLCRCHRNDIERGWEALQQAANPRIHCFLATSPIHMEYKLRKTPEQVLEMIKEGVSFAAKFTSNVEFSAEDASRTPLDFLVRAVDIAIKAGATTINIPDTVGYAQPEEFAERIKYVLENVPDSDKAVFSVHCHNDLGLAVANTLAALKAGARQAEVTVSGLGERAGNAALEEVVMALKVRQDYYGLTTGINTEQILQTCRALSMLVGQPIPANKAIVGANAFAHESGIHQDGVLKNPETYEIMTPESIGRTNTDLVLGKHSGRAAVKSKLTELGYSLSEEQLAIVVDALKKLADRKEKIYDEDVEALVLEEVYRLPDQYRLEEMSVNCATAGVPPTAAVVMQVRGESKQFASFGAGPVDAVFNTINSIIGANPKLHRYAVNAISSGTDAQGEVTVRLEYQGRTAVGRGSDPDILVASAKAYINALNRLEMKNGGI